MKNRLTKIVMYIDSLSRGGAERVFSNLANYFVSVGVEVVVVNDYIPSTDRFYSLDDRIVKRYLRDSLDGNVVVKNLVRICRLRKIIVKEKPDLVLSFLGRVNQRMLLSTFGLRCKKIVSVRNDPNKEYAIAGFRRFFVRNLFKLADGCVFQLCEQSLYFPESVRKRSAIILNPVGKEFFSAERSNCLLDVISVGRLEPQKNHALLIRAFAKIADQFPDEKLIIYGDGSLRNKLSELIAELGICGRVELPGTVTDVAKYLSSCKLFVLSSDYEGLPNALMEAMALGVPVISTDCPCGGPRELIKDARNGVLVPVGDVDALADAMAYCLRDYAAAVAMGVSGRQKAQVYSEEVVYNQWYRYFTNVCFYRNNNF